MVHRCGIGLLTLALTACESASVASDPCAPHGESHGDHCDCDPGYREDGMMCIPRTLPDAGMEDALFIDDVRMTDAFALDCGPHGHAHGSHCHCETGYIEIAGRCVMPRPCVGPDDAAEPNDTHLTATDWTRDEGARSLYACIANEDWFMVALDAGEMVRVDAAFSHAASDIDIHLFAPGDPTHDAPVASGDSTDDDETLSYVASDAGTYLLLVHGYDNRESPYDLSVRVMSP